MRVTASNRRVLLSVACGVFALNASSARASDLYVATTGSDANGGSRTAPFRTVGHCAAVAVAGDTCHLGAGEYPELVAPAHSGTAAQPITFTSTDSTAPAVISGATALTGWTVQQGSIWSAPTSLAFGELFVDGHRMILARSPNLQGGDEYRPTFYNATADSGDGTSLIDATNLTRGDGFWVGAKIYVVAGLAWTADQATVTASSQSAHSLTFSPAITFAAFYSVDATSRYYLYDRLDLLDAPSEWYLDATAHRVYLWLPDGGDPTTHLVTVPATPAGFDLSGRSNIVVSDVTLRSSDLKTSSTTTDCRIENIRDLYPVRQVTLTGSRNVISHAEIAFAAGRCVEIDGDHNTVTASEIHHCDSLGRYLEIVTLNGTQATLSDSRLHDTGRDGMNTGPSALDGTVIEHNEVSNTCLIAKDCGGFYTFQSDGRGTILRYNLVHDVFPPVTPQYNSSQGHGIYLDLGSSNYVVHHNVVYNTGYDAFLFNQPNTNVSVFNNTAVGSNNGSGNVIASEGGGSSTGTTGTVYRNNLSVVLDARTGYCLEFLGSIPVYDHNGYYRSSAPARYNNVAVEATSVTADPLFTDAAHGDFSLRNASPMVDHGAPIAGITDGFTGAAPDIGAYEIGASESPGIRGTPGPVAVMGSDGGTAMSDSGTMAMDAASATDVVSPRDASAMDVGNRSGDGAYAADVMTVSDGGATMELGSHGTDAGGCGCRAVPASARRTPALTAALLALLVVRRNRRRRRAG